MLQGINRLGKSWVGRAVVAVLFALLIVSFAIWGIGDIFRGNVRTQVAVVGDTEVRGEAFRQAYQNEYQSLIRRFRQSITPEQARALGLEGRVLSRLVSEAALDQQTRSLGLSVSDKLVIDSIQADPNFRGATGRFDRTYFTDLIRQNGLSEGQYVADQRIALARQQLAEAVTGALPVPQPLREAVHRYTAERRTAEHVTLAASVLGEVPAPTQEQLASFFNDRKATYRAPEYRTLELLVLTPESIAKPEAVSDGDARAYYDRVKGTRYGQPERRTIEQIVFGNAEEAAAAAARLKEGVTFAAIAGERGIADAGLTLGTFTKAEMFDPAVAEAAFALAEGEASAPVTGRFGPVIVRIAKVESGLTRPFDEVAADVKADLARERARDQIQPVHDAIEEQRAGAKALADIARDRGLATRPVPSVDRQGRDKAEAAVSNLPEREALLAAAFRAEIGADGEAIRTRDGGYVWFEVRAIDPARDRTLDEVRDRVVADWRKAEIARGLSERARDLGLRVDKGEQMATVAAELGLTVATTADISRSAGAPDVPATVAPRIFATPVGSTGSAPLGEDSRLLYKVTAASVPPFLSVSQESTAMDGQLRTALADDVFGQYVSDLEKRLGVRTYPENIRRAIGGE